MTIVTSVAPTTYLGKVMLVTTNTAIEQVPQQRQIIPFQLVIRNLFDPTNYNLPVAFTDDNNTTTVPLVDQNNKPVEATQLQRYAGTRQCIHAQYERPFHVIKICSNMCPIVLSPYCPTPPTPPAGT